MLLIDTEHFILYYKATIYYIFIKLEPADGSFFVIRAFLPKEVSVLLYTSPDKIPYYSECAPLVDELGFVLVELQLVPQKGSVKVSIVIASKNPSSDIGVADCSKVHHALQAKIIALTGRPEEEVYMECCSPGLERNFKDANEFYFFCGRKVKVWDREESDYLCGTIKSCDEKQVTLEKEDGSEKTVAYENIAKAKFINL